MPGAAVCVTGSCSPTHSPLQLLRLIFTPVVLGEPSSRSLRNKRKPRSALPVRHGAEPQLIGVRSSACRTFIIVIVLVSWHSRPLGSLIDDAGVLKGLRQKAPWAYVAKAVDLGR